MEIIQKELTISSFWVYFFDKHLSWSEHISFLSKKISSVCGLLSSMKYFTPTSILKIIYQSLITSYFNYGLILWGKKAYQLFNLQKKAMRIITKSSHLAHTERLFKKENILKLDDLYKTHCLKIYYRLVNNQLPENIRILFPENPPSSHRYPTSSFRVQQNHLLYENQASSEKAKNLLSYTLPRIVNSLPDQVVRKASTHSFLSYKEYAKNYFLGMYSDRQCTVSNCYACHFHQNSNASITDLQTCSRIYNFHMRKATWSLVFHCHDNFLVKFYLMT